MATPAGDYNFAGHLGWPEIVIDQHRPGVAPRILPQLMARSLASADQAQIGGLFIAIDAIAFAYDRPALALNFLERTLQLGGHAREERVLKSLVTARLQNQPLVDAFI